MLNHYQKTYIEVLADLLGGVSPAVDKGGCAALIHEKIGDTSRAYLLCPEASLDTEQRLCGYLVEYLDCGKYAAGILSAIQNAKILTHEKIRNAPYRVASDFAEAADVAIGFVQAEDRQFLTFSVDTGAAEKAYAFFKLPYNGQIDLLYGNEFSAKDKPIHPEREMKYVGFYNRMAGIAYCLEEPLSNLYWFHRRGAPLPEEKSSLREAIIKEIRQTVAMRVSKSVPDFSVHTLKENLEVAELAYAQGRAVLDFADKIAVRDGYISGDDYIRYIDTPEALVEEKTEKYLKEIRQEDLTRLWIAHCAAQQLLDQIVACGGLPSEWNSVHRPLALAALRRMNGKPAYVVTNSEYRSVCQWRIIQVSESVTVENAPLHEKFYEKNWIAFDHEPPRESIETWQSGH
jgi:hypothetical protein